MSFTLKQVVLTFEDVESGEEVGEWAFCDARRLGRLKLADAEDPETVAPLSTLGADPLLAMPTVEALAPLLLKRKAPIKAVLLDQAAVSRFSRTIAISELSLLYP